MSEQRGGQIHNIILEKREKLNMSGVEEIVGFDDETIVLKTSMGGLTIKGDRLHIGSFSTINGEVDIDGKIIALVYTGEDAAKGSFFKRLLK